MKIKIHTKKVCFLIPWPSSFVLYGLSFKYLCILAIKHCFEMKNDKPQIETTTQIYSETFTLSKRLMI